MLILGDDERSISRNIASINILFHDVINLLHYKKWADKWKYFYVYQNAFGEAILAKIRKLEKTMIRYLLYSNHSWFSLLFVRCHNKILAKNQQVKSKIKTELTITILTFAGNFLLQEWVHINHFIRGKFKNNIKQLKGKILESMTPGEFYLVKKFH